MADRMPPLLEEIAEVDGLGLKVALELAAAKGGQRIFIPATVPHDHWLVDIMGLDAARALSDYFCHETGQHIDVPCHTGSYYARRRREYLALEDQGLSANEIAARMGLHNRSVKRRRRQERLKQPLPLFDQPDPQG